MQLPPLESLRCFEAAATTLSFRAAARRVALTPAALGQRIRQLEELLGEPLFARTTRKVSLTEAGLALLPRARVALEAAAECLSGPGGANVPPLELTLGTRFELGMSFLLPLRVRLRSVRPNLTVHFYVGGSGEDLLLRLRGGEVDCAVTSGRVDDPIFDAFRLHREDYALVASPALLERVPLERDEDARRHTLLDISGELPLFGYWRDSPEGGDRLRFGRLWRVGSIEPMRQLVLAGEGVAVLPRYLVGPDLEARRLVVPLPEVEPRPGWFRLVFRAGDPRRPLYEALAQVLVSEPLR